MAVLNGDGNGTWYFVCSFRVGCDLSCLNDTEHVVALTPFEAKSVETVNEALGGAPIEHWRLHYQQGRTDVMVRGSYVGMEGFGLLAGDHQGPHVYPRVARGCWT